jgi:catechol 2,3-dioxygenase-like lactoylglutathione lyase family enzyme
MLVRVMYTTLSVRDQDKALDFYAGQLGFVKRRDHPVRDLGVEVGRWLTVAFEGQDIEVILAPGTQGQGSANLGQSSLDLGELFVESDDLRKDFEKLRSKGVQFVESAPEDYPFGVRVTALDPDGNRVSLRQRRR